MEPEVVVRIKCNVFEHDGDGVVSVRFAPFGLTAYGDTEEEAVTEFKKLFNRFITAYRQKGILENVLTRSAVDWSWKMEYKGEWGEHEDTEPDDPGNAALGIEILSAMDMYQKAWQKKGHDVFVRDFAIAA